MKNNESFDFYSPLNLKAYNLDESIRYQLTVLDHLDNVTKKHSENVANLTLRLCEYLHCKKVFTIHSTICAYLHDIGKAFIPKEILQKPARLTDEEYAVIKTHTTLGYEFCMKDMKLRPYAGGALYHHESLDGSGYPNSLTKKDIPYYAQIIHVADVYDALVSKRQYKTHISISDTLKMLIKDAQPSPKSIALDTLASDTKVGKINAKVLRALFKVVIDDTLYEISCVYEYADYLKSQIKRLETIQNYEIKSQKAKKEKDIEYYKEGMKMLFSTGENADNYKTVLQDYKNAYLVRQENIAKLYNEIKIIKKLRV